MKKRTSFEVKRLFEGRENIPLNITKDPSLVDWKLEMIGEFIRLKNILEFEGPQGLKNEKITTAFVYWYLNTSHNYLKFIFDYVMSGASSKNTWLIRRKTPFETEIERLYHSRSADSYNDSGFVMRSGRSAEILNNPDKYHTSMLRMGDCNLCEPPERWGAALEFCDKI